MNIYHCEPQYRERASQWQMLSALPLYRDFTDGMIFRWFAVNIPMDLGTGGTFTSDIDLLACLVDLPRSHEPVYKTYEVKVSTINKSGAAKSLKAGKIKRTLTQLRAYRSFGSPEVSLLDVFLCEPEFCSNNAFPTDQVIEEAFLPKLEKLGPDGFGYRALAFEIDDDEAVLKMPVAEKIVLPARKSRMAQPFSRLAVRIDEFAHEDGLKPFHQITFCRTCRELVRIRMRESHNCPNCSSDLIEQS